MRLCTVVDESKEVKVCKGELGRSEKRYWFWSGGKCGQMKACQGTWKFSLTLRLRRISKEGLMEKSLRQGYQIELLWWWKCYISALFSMVAISPVCLLSTWNVASMTKKLNFTCYFTLINISSHTWQALAVLDSTALAGAPDWRCDFAVNLQRWPLRMKSWMQSQGEQAHAGISRHLCICLTTFRASSGLLLLFCFPESHLSLSCG